SDVGLRIVISQEWLTVHVDLPSLLRTLLSVDKDSQSASAGVLEVVFRDCVRLVSRGIPWLRKHRSVSLFDDRLFVFSRSVPDCRKLSIGSSRPGRRLDLETWWFDLLRTAVLHCHETDEMLLTAEGSSTCEAVRRAAELFGKPRLHFRPIGRGMLDTGHATLQWLTTSLEYLERVDFGGGSSATIQTLVSPPICSAMLPSAIRRHSSNVTEQCSREVPLADQLLVAASDRTYVISLRKHGYFQSLLESWLREPENPPQCILIASDAGGQLPEATRDLPAGWIPWLVEASERQAIQADNSTRPRQTHGSQMLMREGYLIPTLRRPGLIVGPVRDPIANPEDWLLHWTRPATGPWPDESPDDYLDALILRTERAQRSALATLLQIVADGVLRGSATGIRGGYPVVSLTAVPLSEFCRRRTFRSHLQRFDFEPWGIGFRRSSIADVVREVSYGTESDWDELPHQDRPFFQKATTGGATNNVAEREWRVLNELVFQKLPADDVCLFAPTQQDAQLLALHCRWRIVITPS
ncbi:MAG: hypothetical protein ACK58L_10155, partial [Planctomycetota bacterium]